MRLTLAPQGRTLPPRVRVSLPIEDAPKGISAGALLDLRARLQPPPPMALPVHSALPEDAGRYGFAAPPTVAMNTTLPPPSANSGDFVPLPPLGLPQPSGPTFPNEPLPAPLFSWRPTYIPEGAKSGMFQQALTHVEEQDR